MTKPVNCRFQSSFFAKFPWLEYSVQQDARYSFADVTGAKKVHRLLNLQNFLTGIKQRVKTRINSSQLIC